ncbi:ribonuclease H-like domain-containing protein [Tanacetum coccineum]
MAGEDEFHDDNPPPPPPPVTPTQQAPHTLSTIKLHILKKGEYDIWAMKMEHYLRHIDYPIWEVIQKGNGLVQVSTDTNGQIRVLPPKTVEDILARERERKARTTLLMSIPEDHLAKFHKMTDAKEMWEAIKSKFGGNDESKKMQKYILNQLEIHYAGVSTEDANQKFLRSLPASWSQADEFDLEEMDLKWKVAMISMRLKKFYKKTRRRLQFNAKEPVGFDKTKVECFNCHKTGHFDRECRSKGNQESRRRDAGNTGYKAKDNGRRPGKQDEPKDLVTLDGDAEAVKEKEELKTKLENFQSSTKGLSKLLNSPMSTKDKSGLGYGNQYMKSKISESDAKTSDFDSCETNSSLETLESIPEPVVVEPKIVSQPKVWSDAPIIEEYESDSDDEYVIEPSKEQEKPSFAFVNTVKHVKTPRETVKEQNICSPSPKANKRDWNGLMSKKLGLGYGFSKKACFVCGRFSHLIIDCDFHEKRMVKQVELNKKKDKCTGLGENRHVWNNVKRLNHQNKFVPKAVLTKTGIFPVNTARPIVNEIR